MSMRSATTIVLALATGLATFATQAADGVDQKLGTVERALEAGRDKERALEAKTETIEQQITAWTSTARGSRATAPGCFPSY